MQELQRLTQRIHRGCNLDNEISQHLYFNSIETSSFLIYKKRKKVNSNNCGSYYEKEMKYTSNLTSMVVQSPLAFSCFCGLHSSLAGSLEVMC